MLKTIALVVVTLFIVVVGVVLAYAATKPDLFRVQRSASIKAPPEKIFPLINDFRSWSSWSPYEHKDPAMKKTFSGAALGKGAVYEWEGDKNVGSGRIEIADTSPPNKVSIKLDMIKPFAAHNQVEFRLEPRGDVTDVTWAMNGHTPYLAKVMHVFIDVDRMVGQDFEAGLASLKAVAEK
jgi:carbon monoxide dehydrogenase subunit G